MVQKIIPRAICLVFLACSLSSGQDETSFFDDRPISNPVTGPTYLFVGDDLILNCSLSEDFLHNFTAHNISFSLQFQAESEAICIPASSVLVVDINLAMLIIRNVTLRDAGPYGCYVGGTFCEDEYNDNAYLVGTSKDIYIEYYPQNVTNFQCMIYNWDEFMTCTWQHPVNYVSMSDIKVTTVYNMTQDLSLDCPTPHINSCTWNRENLSPVDSYSVQVAVANIKKSARTTSVFTVNLSTIVKPEPVKNFTIAVSEELPGCLLLSWNHSKIYRNKVYRLKHQDWGDKKFHILQDNLNVTAFNACGYHPYTFHNFSVECYPTVVNSGYWSDPIYAAATTLMTAPDSGPRVTNGSFTTTACVGKQRTVTLLWQEVELSAQNGIIDGYLIKSEEKILENVTADKHSANVNLPCYIDSKLTIFAHNEGGYSVKPAVLIIPPVTFSLPKDLQESFSVEIRSDQHGDSLHALWEVHENPSHRNYTIFWCQSLSGRLCTGQINWMKVEGSKTYYDIPMPSVEAEKYLFGISVTDIQTEMASEIFWTWCLFRHNHSIQNVIIKSLDVTSGVNEVQVSWTQIPCTYQSMIKVTNYTVKWCQTTRCNETNEVFSSAVPAMEYMYTVSDLKASVQYSFTVQPVSYEEVGSEVKPWKDAIPIASDLSTPMIPVFLGIFIPLAFILLAALIYRNFITGRKKTTTLATLSRMFLEKNFTSEIQVSQPQVMHTYAPCSQEAVVLLSLRREPSNSSTDSDYALVAVSTQRPHMNVSTQRPHVNVSTQRPHMNENTLQLHNSQDESVYFNSDSTQLYRRFAQNQSLDSSCRQQESVSSSYPESVPSYHHLAYTQSRQSSDNQTDLKLIEKPSTEHSSKNNVEIEENLKRKVVLIPDRSSGGITKTSVMSTVLQHNSMSVPTENVHTNTSSDRPLAGVTDSTSVLENCYYLPHEFSESSGAGTSSYQFSTGESVTNDDASSQGPDYIQINSSFSTDSDNTS